jgi:hypothetical protein
MSEDPESGVIEHTYYHVVQRQHFEGLWVDSSAKYHGVDGIPEALVAQAQMMDTFGPSQVKLVRREITTIEVEVLSDVHTEHCCAMHGCKYGDDQECTVFMALKPQAYACEECAYDLDEGGGWVLAHLMNEMYDKGAKKVGTCESCQAPIGAVCSFCA